MLAFEICSFLVGLAVWRECCVCPFKYHVFCSCYSVLSLSLRFKWLLIINLFYESVYTYMYMCAYVCLWRSKGQAWVLSSGVPAKPLMQGLSLVWSSAVIPDLLGQGALGILLCAEHRDCVYTVLRLAFYVIGGVFVVTVCLLMECFSSSALAVVSNTTNFNIFVFCLLQFFFTHFPPSAQFCVDKTLV